MVGDVLEPGNYRHIEGTTIEQYINLAAGFTATAKKKRCVLHSAKWESAAIE